MLSEIKFIFKLLSYVFSHGIIGKHNVFFLKNSWWDKKYTTNPRLMLQSSLSTNISQNGILLLKIHLVMLSPCPYQTPHWDLTQLKYSPLLLSLDICILITEWKNIIYNEYTAYVSPQPPKHSILCGFFKLLYFYSKVLKLFYKVSAFSPLYCWHILGQRLPSSFLQKLRLDLVTWAPV